MGCWVETASTLRRVPSSKPAIHWISPSKDKGSSLCRPQMGLRYTRDGSFHRSQKGLLVTGADEPVLSASGQPIASASGRGISG